MRHKKVEKRTIEPDVLHHNRVITKFINYIMKDGKKSVAERLVYNALNVLEKKGQNPLETFEKAIQNVGPKQEVRPRRVGGASYQVPVEVKGDRKMALAIRWILQAARSKSNKEFHTFEEKLAQELLDASQNLGAAIKKRDTVQKSADANRAFAHFRW